MKATGLLAGLFGLALGAQAQTYQHAILISIDGMHAEDLHAFIKHAPHSTLASWAKSGVRFDQAYTPAPADSFPGLIALITGGQPTTTGIWYDVTYNHLLAAPSSDCSVRGTEVAYDETIDNTTNSALDPNKLPRDPDHGCSPVYPHAYLKVNTIFDVVQAAGGKTAWIDKHPAYEIVLGPHGHAVDDLYTPEIGANFEGKHDNPKDKITASIDRTAEYDHLKMQALLYELKGLGHDGQHPGTVPELMGMNMQVVSVAQKLAGYHGSRPQPALQRAFEDVDQRLSELKNTLQQQHLLDNTFIIISAKHGNSPINSSLVRHLETQALKQVIENAAPGALAHLTADDGGLIWLKDAQYKSVVIHALLQQRHALGILHVLDAQAAPLNYPRDERSPDIVIISQHGVIYGHAGDTKLAEHGGYGRDDRHVLLLVVDASQHPQHLVHTRVSTQQVAPTLLVALGLNPDHLEALHKEAVLPLPGLTP